LGKKNLGWVAFLIWMTGTIIVLVGHFRFGKDYSLIGIISFIVFGALAFVHELLNKTPPVRPWKIYAVLGITGTFILTLLV